MASTRHGGSIVDRVQPGFVVGSHTPGIISPTPVQAWLRIHPLEHGQIHAELDRVYEDEGRAGDSSLPFMTFRKYGSATCTMFLANIHAGNTMT